MTLEPPRGYVKIGDRLKLAPPVRQYTCWYSADCPDCAWSAETMTGPGARLSRRLHRRKWHRSPKRGT